MACGCIIIIAAMAIAIASTYVGSWRVLRRSHAANRYRIVALVLGNSAEYHRIFRRNWLQRLT
jgi:hypothetical protein